MSNYEDQIELIYDLIELIYALITLWYNSIDNHYQSGHFNVFNLFLFFLFCLEQAIFAVPIDADQGIKADEESQEVEESSFC